MEKQKRPVWYKRRRNWIIAVVAIVLIIVGWKATHGAPKSSETTTVNKGEVSEELVLSGDLRATQNAALPFSSSGTLSWVGVKMGDHVVRGQALAKLDTTVLNAAYQQSLATLHAAEANVNEIHDNLKDKNSTETFSEVNTRVAAETAHDKAYESMVAAQKALKDSTLLAPFDGIVAKIANESAGMNITATVPQITIVNPSTLYFLVNADQTDVSRIHLQDKSEIVFDAFPEDHVDATVTQISFTPSTEESGTVYPVRLTLHVDNSSYLYKIGMTGDSHFILSRKDNALWVPTKFVKTDKSGKYVVTDEKGTKKYITVGIEGDERVEIMGDISEGQTVYY